MIHVIISKDDYLLQQTLSQVTGPVDSSVDNVVRFDEREATPDELARACLTSSFLGNRSIVLVRGLLARFKGVPPGGGRGRSKAAQLQSWLDSLGQLQNLPPTTILIFLEQEDVTPERNAFLRALSSMGVVHRPEQPREQGVPRWIRERCQEWGVGIRPDAAARLANLIGPNLGLLLGEVEKLALFTSGRDITIDDVDALVGERSETKVWDLVDAAVEGRTGDATAALRRLLDEGEPPQGLLALIARELRSIAICADLAARGASDPEIMIAARIQEWTVRRLRHRARLIGRHITDAYDAVLEADAAVKRGLLDEQTSMYLLVHRLAALASPPRSAPAPAGIR